MVEWPFDLPPPTAPCGTISTVWLAAEKAAGRANPRKNSITPVEYEGSTTGPGYNEKGSPFQVSWSVRPKVAKVNIESVGKWCQGNTFKEDHAHGVRNLVVNLDLLSKIQ